MMKNINSFAKKMLFTIALFFSMVILFGTSKVFAASSYQKQYSKGTEFSAGLFSYRVIKAPKKNKCGEVEITGFNPSPEEGVDFFSEYDYSDPSADYGFQDHSEYWNYYIVGIADNAFRGDVNLKSFSVTSPYFRYVGKNAFEGCTNLKYFSVTWDDFTTIKANAFFNCYSLKTIYVDGENLKHIGKNAFLNTSPNLKVKADLKSASHKTNKNRITRLKRIFKKAGARKPKFKINYYKPIHVNKDSEFMRY